MMQLRCQGVPCYYNDFLYLEMLQRDTCLTFSFYYLDHKKQKNRSNEDL